jgi:hypothetical protein
MSKSPRRVAPAKTDITRDRLLELAIESAAIVVPTAKPIGHFVRHSYDANGELMGPDAA